MKYLLAFLAGASIAASIMWCGGENFNTRGPATAAALIIILCGGWLGICMMKLVQINDK